VLTLSVCGCAATKKAPNNDIPLATIKKYRTEAVAEVRLFISGAVSRRLARDRDFQPLHLYLVAGTNTVLRHEASATVIIGEDSPEGRWVVEILEDEEPWTWKGFDDSPFSNALTLIGRLGTNEWTYHSFYPDPNIGQLMTRIRIELKDLTPN
jgi:hypothetical protein